MTGRGSPPSEGVRLTEAVSVATVDLYGECYGHTRTTATTYIKDNVVVCVLEGILSDLESSQVAAGEQAPVIDDRVAFQQGAQDEFTAAVEHLTQRTVTVFLSASQTSPSVARELFFLQPPLEG